VFDDLDSTLAAILDDASAPTELRNADVSFQTPDKNFTPGQATVNLFLFDVKENRTRREQVPHAERSGDLFVRRFPPLRVDCTYLVTTWSNEIGAIKVAEEHRLLGLAFLWLSRFGTVPDAFLQGSLVNEPFAPLALLARMDGKPAIGEFWSALATSPRPSFTLVATITMSLPLEFPEGPPVVTHEIRLEVKDVPGTQEASFEIAGTVRNAATLAPVANATVTVLDLDRATQTDAQGRFRFAGLQSGPHTLRTTAAGFVTLDRAITVPAAALNAYDASLTT
jgi:uncharacterized protein DUF4255/carboxypeptidase family protein